MTEQPPERVLKNRRQPHQVKANAANNSLFPPLWSIGFALLLALICVAALAIIIVLIGGNAAPERPPQLVILTAPPIATSVAEVVEAAETPEVASSPVQIRQLAGTSAPLDFVMEGPVLPTPVLTPTALSISIGTTIRVIDVGDQQLNVRELPGVIDVDVVFRTPENTLFAIVDGPSQGDGLTWWKIQDPQNSQRTGWAASNYLEVVPPEAEAQPTA